jgi:UDP-2,3-diacylglucosamine pyrophosphatase LpxH
MKMDRQRPEYRALFISDLHLGSISCNVGELQAFLHAHNSEQLYLVGDIVDAWVAGGKKKFRQEHANVIRTLLGKAKHGSQIFYCPGNHDALLRRINGSEVGNILIDHEFIHTTLSGDRYLVVHGDLFDKSVTKFTSLAWIGAWMHEFNTSLTQSINQRREKKDRKPINFANNMKRLVKRAVKNLTNFDDSLLAAAESQGLQGVICGHTHRPAMMVGANGGVYYNCGDWMEHCTALVENWDGTFQLMKWNPQEGRLESLIPILKESDLASHSFVK